METSAATRNPSLPSRPSLPQKKAFVLRFADDAGPETGVFAGRIEHVTSGDQAAFSSVEQLWTFVRVMLERPDRPSPALPAARRAVSRPSALPVGASRGVPSPAWQG